MDDPPAGWTVWTDEPDGRLVLVYRPDVFDAEAFPAECLPTVYVTHGPAARRPPTDPRAPRVWRVELRLEPGVLADESTADDREAALLLAREAAADFAAGDYPPREVYARTDDREAYLDRLADLVGR
jgi:hypothetical protein